MYVYMYLYDDSSAQTLVMKTLREALQIRLPTDIV